MKRFRLLIRTIVCCVALLTVRSALAQSDIADGLKDVEKDRYGKAVIMQSTSQVKQRNRPGGSDTPNRNASLDNQKLVSLFLNMDNDGDEGISIDEAQGQLKTAFERIDENKDGYLTRSELQALALRLSSSRNRPASANRNGGTEPTMSTEQFLKLAPEGVTVIPDIAYRAGHEAWKLDLAMPTAKSDTLRPAIIYIHGGGWTKGDKRGPGIETSLAYATKGFVSLSVNYRLDADKKACVEDVKCATRWLRANAKRFNVDPHRIGAAGNSAGAHLALMLAICPPDAGLEGDGPYQQYSSAVQAAHCSSTPAKPNHRTRKGDNSDYSNIQAMTYVKADTPPLYFIHGAQDVQKAPVQYMDEFVKALREVGAKDVTYQRYEDAGHGVYVQHIQEARPAREAFFVRILMKQADQDSEVGASPNRPSFQPRKSPESHSGGEQRRLETRQSIGHQSTDHSV